jgi:hypothetical protein
MKKVEFASIKPLLGSFFSPLSNSPAAGIHEYLSKGGKIG